MDDQSTPPSADPQTEPVRPEPPVQSVATPPVATEVRQDQPPTKYLVRRAILDTIAAIRANLLAYIVSMLLAGVAVLVGVVVLIIPVFTIYATIAHSGGVSTGTTTGLIIGAIIFAVIWVILSGAYFVIYTALTLDAGANGRRSGIRETFRASTGALMRVVAANVLLGLIAFGPSILAIFLAFVLALKGGPLAAISFLLGIAAIVWFYAALIRYVLAPYVAIFEPDVPILELLPRSRELMKNGGQWFVVKGVAGYILVLLVLAFITGASMQKLATPISVLFNLASILLQLLASGAVVMLYRNRRLVKG